MSGVKSPRQLLKSKRWQACRAFKNVQFVSAAAFINVQFVSAAAGLGVCSFCLDYSSV
jgi:hypothetical protein